MEISRSIGAPAFPRVLESARTTDGYLNSQTAVLKVSLGMICCTDRRERHAHETVQGQEGTFTVRYRSFRVAGVTEETLLNSVRRSMSSAGILMYRRAGATLEVLLVHLGGPYWRSKDEGAWSIPKGELDAGEDAGEAARREFTEETGFDLAAPLEPLGEIRQRGGKRVTAFAVEGDIDVTAVKSNTFEIDWPPRSGKLQTFPEIDRAEWFDLPTARAKILESQRPFLERLAKAVGGPGAGATA
jgi:predicted NUDIX family NTP pyrophosphohydrolase